MVSAEVVISCAREQLDATVTYLAEIGFRMLKIFPADAPRIAVLDGHGVRLRLAESVGAPATIRLTCASSELAAFDGARAPNGSLIEVADEDEFSLPAVQQELVVSRMSEDDWGVGRAGMRYRDLIPGRQGGRFVGSHIQITKEGPVGDYEHYHKVRFQALYCYRGWVKLVYEGQGEPFVMQSGDCVLQPPGIRHRVLESSAGLEVIEVACPAEHETLRDHDLELPTAVMPPSLPLRPLSAGQLFVWHRGGDASWGSGWVRSGAIGGGWGFEHQELGISAATNNLAQLLLVRPVVSSGSSAGWTQYHDCADAEFHFLFVLEGALDVRLDHELATSEPGEHEGAVGTLHAGDSVVLPGTLRRAYRVVTEATRVLEVFLPLADDSSGAVAPAAGANGARL